MNESISEQLAEAVARAGKPPREIVEKLLIDVAGLCVAARNTDYVHAALEVARRLKTGERVVTFLPDGGERYLSERFWSGE